MGVNSCNCYLDRSGKTNKTYAEVALVKTVFSTLLTTNMFVFDLDTLYWQKGAMHKRGKHYYSVLLMMLSTLSFSKTRKLINFTY